MIQQIREWFEKRRIMDIQRFAHSHRNYLVLVCDPKDDTMFMSFRDKHIAGRISSADGVNHKVVKNVLKHSTFEREIDRLIGGVMDALTAKGERCKECKQALHDPSKYVSSFFNFIDGALFNISKSLKKSK